MRVSRAALAIAPAALAVMACTGIDEPSVPSEPMAYDLCQRPRAIKPEFGQGDALADKTLALTFDDGPSEITSELSTYLKGQGIAATFFVNGAYVAGAEDVLAQVVSDGHLIGNHTQTHAALTTLSAAEVVREVEETDTLIAKHLQAGKLFFRPPFGDWSADVQKTIAASAMNKYAGPIGWDIGDHLGPDTAADWDCWDAQNGTRTVAECGALYLKEIAAKKKGIVLLHDGPPNGEGAKTLQMVQTIVPKLKADGYKFLRIDAVPFGATAGTTGGAAGGGAAGGGANGGGDPCAKR